MTNQWCQNNMLLINELTCNSIINNGKVNCNWICTNHFEVEFEVEFVVIEAVFEVVLSNDSGTHSRNGLKKINK